MTNPKYKDAISRLEEIAKESQLDLELAKKEKDWEKVDRLRQEALICSTAAGFLINDSNHNG